MIFGQPRICQLTSLNNFHIIPDRFPFDASPVEKLLPGLNLQNFWKFYIFSVESSSSRRGYWDRVYRPFL